jgi:hypothetical protein
MRGVVFWAVGALSLAVASPAFAYDYTAEAACSAPQTGVTADAIDAVIAACTAAIASPYNDIALGESYLNRAEAYEKKRRQ